MEEIQNTGFDPSSVVYVAVAVASFCAAAALLIGVTEWVPYATATRAAGSHDPQAGMGRGLELLVSNAVLVAMTAIVLSTLILFTAGQKGTGRLG